MPQRRSAYLAWIAVCFIWGTTYLAIRIALESIPPLLMTSVRWITAGSLILAVLAARGASIPSISTWPQLTLLGILFMGFGNGGVVFAEQYIPSGLAAVLVAAIPFWMVAVEWFMRDAESLSSRRLAGLAIGFSGIVLLVWPELKPGSGAPFLLGVVATQMACLGWALGSSYARRRHADENVFAASALQMLLGGIVILVAGLLAGEWERFAMTPRTAAAVLYLVVFGSIVGFLAYAYALRHLPIATVSLYAYVNPVIAVVLGTAILGEAMSPRLAASAGVVLAGMWLVRGD